MPYCIQLLGPGPIYGAISVLIFFENIHCCCHQVGYIEYPE